VPDGGTDCHSTKRGGTAARANSAPQPLVMHPEVRELARRRGLDPVEDRSAVRRLVEEVVADYDERTLTSSLAPLADPRAAARAVDDDVAGFGPLQRHLDDPAMEETWI
jgi:pilus assembly protein CpaF